MDFSFSSEQDDLRREARAFLEANPSPTMDQLRELGWVGILQGEDFTFLDAAVLFEELGRVLYDGPYVLNEVAGQPRRRSLVDRGRRVRAASRPGRARAHARHAGRARAGRDARDGRRVARARQALAERCESRAGRVGRRAAPPARCARAGGGRHRQQGDRARDRVRLRARAVRQEDRHLPGGLAFARRRVRRGRALPLARVLGGLGRRRGRRAGRSGGRRREVAGGRGGRARACEKSIQAHGGIGFTWEHPLHRYYKRALWIEGALGYGREHRAEIAASCLLSSSRARRPGSARRPRAGSPRAAGRSTRPCAARARRRTGRPSWSSTSPTRRRSRARRSGSSASTRSSTTPASRSPRRSSSCRPMRSRTSSTSTSSASCASLQAFLPALREARGRVVLMGSIAGRCALPFLGAYAMSKFALEAMADCAAGRARAVGDARRRSSSPGRSRRRSGRSRSDRPTRCPRRRRSSTARGCRRSGALRPSARRSAPCRSTSWPTPSSTR